MNIRMKKTTLTICLSMMLALASSVAIADGAAKFKHKERSTIDNFPLHAIGQEELANAVIEGGLEAPSAGASNAYQEGSPNLQNTLDFDSLSRQTDPGRMDSNIGATVNFQTPRNIPGQAQTGQYVIAPPSNRNYQVQNITTTSR